MSLRDRLKKATGKAVDSDTGAASGSAQQSSIPSAPGGSPDQKVYVAGNAKVKKGERFDEVKAKVHTLIVENMNLSATDNLSMEEASMATWQFLEQFLLQEKIPMGQGERAVLVQELVEEIVGLGPLEPLLKDPLISEIMVNGPKKIYIEKNGKLQKTNVQFKDDAQLMHVIERIVSAVGRRVDEKNPMVDARLSDGSRFNAIIPPLALDGASVSIRRFKKDAGTLDKLLGWGSLTEDMAYILEVAMKLHLNIVISGGTGSGKTTMLNSLSSLIAEDERIVTIEDSAELQLQQDHVVRLETRPANIEGEGKIEARQLLINSLRMRPDRIVVGECRGPETLEMLQAMNTGHDGSLTTLHANSPRDAVARIVTMCMMNDNPLPEQTIRQQISSAVHLIVQIARLSDGQRKTTSIAEIVGMEGNIVAMQDIFKYQQTGISDEGKVIGHHTATGVRPKFADMCRYKGITLPEGIFDPVDAEKDFQKKPQGKPIADSPEIAAALEERNKKK